MIGAYYCEGMRLYGDNLINKMGFVPYDKHLPALFLGIYFNEDLEVWASHAKQRYVFWNGSDVLRLKSNPGWIKALREDQSTIHAAHHGRLADEVSALIGHKVEVAPTLFGCPDDYPTTFVPVEAGQHVKVFMTAHPQREVEYGILKAMDLMSELPYHDLYVYGVSGRSYNNVHFKGIVSEVEWDYETQSMHCALRLNVHDGVSQIVIKAILRGQQVVVTPDPWQAFKRLRNVPNVREPRNRDIPDLNKWITRVKSQLYEKTIQA